MKYGSTALIYQFEQVHHKNDRYLTLVEFCPAFLCGLRPRPTGRIEPDHALAVAVGESLILTDTNSNSLERTSRQPVAVDGCMARRLADN